jgi:hypothetical protein
MPMQRKHFPGQQIEAELESLLRSCCCVAALCKSALHALLGRVAQRSDLASNHEREQ